ncbi:MAG TPA: DUF6157 family protein [Bacillales bacterium]|nr:DUF6157 family protein [Bacillales bacterium]
MNYCNTLILISDDSPVQESKIPASGRPRKTVAEIEYELLIEKPGRYTQDELQFETHMKHKEIPENLRDEEKTRFLGKSRACMRASALPKRFGWGIYFDKDGMAGLVPVESDQYKELQIRDDIKKVKAMKSKRS